jgi:hypothetical protein
LFTASRTTGVEPSTPTVRFAQKAAVPSRAQRGLNRSLDTAAVALARDNGIPFVVSSVDKPGAIPSALGKGRARYVMPLEVATRVRESLAYTKIPESRYERNDEPCL